MGFQPSTHTIIKESPLGLVIKLELPRENSLIKSQDHIQSCWITYMLGTQLMHWLTVGNVFHITKIYRRFLKADPATKKFNVKIFDMALTHPTWFTEQRHRSFGKCFTIHPDQKARFLIEYGLYFFPTAIISPLSEI